MQALSLSFAKVPLFSIFIVFASSVILENVCWSDEEISCRKIHK
jgi:hypothetical protein